MGVLEELASAAIPDIEAVADDRKPHRMTAIEQLTIFNGLEAEVERDARRATAVPTRSMPRLGLVCHLVCWGT